MMPPSGVNAPPAALRLLHGSSLHSCNVPRHSILDLSAPSKDALGGTQWSGEAAACCFEPGRHVRVRLIMYAVL